MPRRVGQRPVAAARCSNGRNRSLPNPLRRLSVVLGAARTERAKSRTRRPGSRITRQLDATASRCHPSPAIARLRADANGSNGAASGMPQQPARQVMPPLPDRPSTLHPIST